MGIIDFFSYGPHAKMLFSDFTIGGVIFSLWYIFSTAILPNIYMIYFKQYKQMNTLGLLIWFGIQLLWQGMVLYSLYEYLNYEVSERKGDNINNYTYNLFVKGGWDNFQKWLSYYATDIWGDIILLSFIFILPIGIFDKYDGREKVQFIFTKIGLFSVFLFFILGPPTYHISTEKITLHHYLNNVLQFEGDPHKTGYLEYLNTNKTKIIQILLALTLIVYIFISGKKKYKERKISSKPKK